MFYINLMKYVQWICKHACACPYLVQWMQRFITVFTRGPRFLSSTARLVSTNRLLSLPKIMAWSWRSHSPPWSQMGQSRGGLICALNAQEVMVNSA